VGGGAGRSAGFEDRQEGGATRQTPSRFCSSARKGAAELVGHLWQGPVGHRFGLGGQCGEPVVDGSFASFDEAVGVEDEAATGLHGGLRLGPSAHTVRNVEQKGTAAPEEVRVAVGRQP